MASFGSSFQTTVGEHTWSRQKVRKLCETWPGGLFFFTKFILHRPKLTMGLHFPFANFIQLHPWSKMAPEYSTRPAPRLSHRKTAYMPRVHYKSTIISEAFPLWLLSCVDRNMTIGLVSAVSDNTEKWLKKMRETVTYNPVFRWAYPEIRQGEKWDATQMEVTRDVGGDAQASITALSIKQGLASQHFDYIICDDLVNEQTAESVVEMERAVRLYYSLEEILKGWRDSRGFLVVGTPWGREDVLHDALKEADRGTRYKWGIGTGCKEVGVMPHFQISEELREMYPDELVPNLDMSRPILPSECNEEALLHIKAQSVDKLYLNYACKPYDEGRNGFDMSKFRVYGELPDGQLICKCHENKPGHDHHLRHGSMIAVSDPAYTRDKKNCETAILIGTKFSCGCRFLLHDYGEHILPSDYVDIVPTIAQAYQTYLKGWGIEDEALQVTLKEWLVDRQKDGRFPPGVEIFGLKVKNREKDGRIGAAVTPVNEGRWHIKPTMKLVKGRNNTLHQLFQWPYSNKRDRADAFAYFDQGWDKFPPVAAADTDLPRGMQSNKRRWEADKRLMEDEA